MEGDYLSYDTVRRKWIRSRKVSGLGKMHVLLDATIHTQEMLVLLTRLESTVTIGSIHQEASIISEECEDTLRILKYIVGWVLRERRMYHLSIWLILTKVSLFGARRHLNN